MSCTVSGFNIEKLQVPPGTRLLLLRTSKDAQLPNQAKGAEYVDDTTSLTQRLNAAWTPRWYFYDSDLKLIDLQIEPSDMEVTTTQ